MARGRTAKTLISRDEEKRWDKKYKKKSDLYRRLSADVLRQLYSYKQENPDTVRIVLSRDPEVKEFDKIVGKISKKRRKTKEYSYDSLTDIIAFTILCPYKSDIYDIIDWIKKAFDIQTSDAEARRTSSRGHRGYHYIVCLRKDFLGYNPQYKGIKFEIQVKTLLEEAFDAKTHDLTYKPGERRVPRDLKRQFGILSSALKNVDDQSEFLKDVLTFEERESVLRREAAALAYVGGAEAVAKKLNLNMDNLNIQETSNKLSGRLAECLDILDRCKFAHPGSDQR